MLGLWELVHRLLTQVLSVLFSLTFRAFDDFVEFVLLSAFWSIEHGLTCHCAIVIMARQGVDHAVPPFNYFTPNVSFSRFVWQSSTILRFDALH